MRGSFAFDIANQLYSEKKEKILMTTDHFKSVGPIRRQSIEFQMNIRLRELNISNYNENIYLGFYYVLDKSIRSTFGLE